MVWYFLAGFIAGFVACLQLGRYLNDRIENQDSKLGKYLHDRMEDSNDDNL